MMTGLLHYLTAVLCVDKTNLSSLFFKRPCKRIMERVYIRNQKSVINVTSLTDSRIYPKKEEREGP